MHDARDAEDKRLLDERDHKLLLANYFHPVLERCFVRLRNRDLAHEAAQQVFTRLLSELRRGRTYKAPYRVVVHMVTEWTLRLAGRDRGATKACETWPSESGAEMAAG